MKYEMYVIYDKVAGIYGNPTCMVNEGTARRWFNAVTAQNEMAEPTDFELYHVGVYDTLSGTIFSESPRFICKGVVANA